ncbi:MAG: hypothetical protein K2X46_04210 [Roseomonas sp.]|nr:hypothetical protein [Roseomonas sp.]
MATVRDAEARRRIDDLRARIAHLEAAPGRLAHPKRQDFDRIVKAVCEEFDVGIGAIFGDSRAVEFARARMAVYSLAQQVLGMSTPRIGRLLGRDHSTIISGCRRIRMMAAQDTDLAARMARLVKNLTPSTERIDA